MEKRQRFDNLRLSILQEIVWEWCMNYYSNDNRKQSILFEYEKVYMLIAIVEVYTKNYTFLDIANEAKNACLAWVERQDQLNEKCFQMAKFTEWYGWSSGERILNFENGFSYHLRQVISAYELKYTHPKMRPVLTFSQQLELENW